MYIHTIYIMAMMSKLKNPAMSLMTELQLRTDFHLLLLSLILGELLLPMDAGASYRSTPVHQQSVICVMCVAWQIRLEVWQKFVHRHRIYPHLPR